MIITSSDDYIVQLYDLKGEKVKTHMEEVMLLISNVGFPIAVSTYLLLRLEPVIKGLQKSITGLTLVMAKQNDMNKEQLEKILELYGVHDEDKRKIL